MVSITISISLAGNSEKHRTPRGVKLLCLLSPDCLLDELRDYRIALEPKFAVIRVQTTPRQVTFLLNHTRPSTSRSNQEQRSLGEIIRLSIDEEGCCFSIGCLYPPTYIAPIRRHRAALSPPDRSLS